MLVGRVRLVFLPIMLWTWISQVETTGNEPVLPIQSIILANSRIECPEVCSSESCSKSLALNANCTKLIRDQCDCCTVCLRRENDLCGGRVNAYGICDERLLCYPTNRREQTGICVKACLKFQCLSIVKDNRTTCECASRSVPCDKNLYVERRDNCENRSVSAETHSPTYLKAPEDHLSLLADELIDCSNIVCKTSPGNSSACPSDSQFTEDYTPPFSVCCEPHGQCVCSTCPKTICGEHSFMQIYRTGNPNLPGQCCDQFNCIKNSKQCHHNKKIYHENETWTLDHCTNCTCRSGLVDCVMVQCPTYTHCGYMYKPENECCPKCGGCLNDRFHVQHMNSTWIESNGCMRCWCENGRSRCIAEGCIAPPCENPRQIANVCCPVCDDETEDYSQETQSVIGQKCPPLNHCLLVCEHGLTKDEQGCFQCACSTMSCPSPLCALKFEKSSKQYCLCLPPAGTNCGQLQCDKHCPYSYSMDQKTGCPICACNPCPQLLCTKNCTYGLKRNEVGCPICVCQSELPSSTELVLHTWNRQCQSGSSSYSNGEIWFDGCRQCFCHKGEQLCALISCPVPRCAQPILLPNRCCPSCPDIPMLPEPIPSSQVCYASQYVTGEELEFDKCTKCICLHNIAFCSISLCPPLSCSIPIDDPTLCCPICPPSTESSALLDLSTTEDDVCLLDDGTMKHAGELWKNNDCQSCLCPRGKGGLIECYSQTCDQQLACSNPVLKKDQCCPFCLPPTAAVAVCIFNYVQYRSGEHWNVSECHHCECSLGTIVCHQHKCPALTCVHTVTLAGHCCPICRNQLPLFNNQEKVPISPPRFAFSIIILFSILILILVLVILVLIFVLLRGERRSISSANQLSNRSTMLSPHQTVITSRSIYGYNLMFVSTDANNPPLPRTSTHSNIGTSSSNNELEPITYDEDDTLILQCSTSSNDDDYQHELNSLDNEESHQQQQQSSQSPFQVMIPSPTIIYV